VLAPSFTAHHDSRVKHVSPADLDELDDVLRELHAVDGLTEKKRGVFYRGSRAFLHFHEDPTTRLYADVRVDTGFERFRVTTKAERKRLVSLVLRATRP
jgi:hypothetical protein